MSTLTVCIITLNEERRIGRALASVRELADEVLVVDSGSTDRTRELAAEAGARVLAHPWRGFGAQRNVALEQATGEWVLELDADEWCSAEFAQELRSFLALPPPARFCMAVIPMRQRFLGRDLGPAGHYPFYRARLFRRTAYRHNETRTVHEGLWPREQPWVFRSELGHELAGSVHEALHDVWAYARLESRGLATVDARSVLVGTLARPPVKFLYRTLLLGGWRDGLRGIFYTALQCSGDALTWLHAWTRRSSRDGQDARGADPMQHFGRLAPRDGPVFLLAVGNPSGPHGRWLRDAVAAGAWVSVICSERDAAPSLAGDAKLRISPLRRMGPVAVLRARDAESQLAPVDAHVALDASGRRLLRAVPFATAVVDPSESDARELVDSLRPQVLSSPASVSIE